MIAACLALLAAPAFGADFFLESPERAIASEAAELEKAAVAGGHAARVVRRFVDGAGWRYVVRVGGFTDQAAAQAAAKDLAVRLDGMVGVFETHGPAAARVASVAPPAPAAESAAAPATAVAGPVVAELPDNRPDADDVLEAVVAAHGLAANTLSALLTGPTVVAYRRTLPGQVVDHTWSTADSMVRLEIEGVEGDVVPSKTLLVGDAAWLSVRGGAWQPQALPTARAHLDALAPQAVLPLVFSLRVAVQTRREFERMRVDREDQLDGEPVTVLRFEGDRATGPLTLYVGTEDRLVRRADFGDGQVVHDFGTYARSGPLALPASVRTTRAGEWSGTVELRRIEVGGDLPSDWFDGPQ